MAVHYIPFTIMTAPIQFHWKIDELLLTHNLFSKKAKTWFPRDKPVKISTHSLTTSHIHNSTASITLHPSTHKTFGSAAMQPAEVIQPTINQRIATSNPCANATCQSKQHGPVMEKGVETPSSNHWKILQSLL